MKQEPSQCDERGVLIVHPTYVGDNELWINYQQDDHGKVKMTENIVRKKPGGGHETVHSLKHSIEPEEALELVYPTYDGYKVVKVVEQK